MQGAESDARRMLEAFGKAGTQQFDVTLTNTDGAKTKFRRGLALGVLRHDLPALLARSDRLKENVIIRPYLAPPVFLLQLDDLDAIRLQRVQAVAFLTVETSPGSFQAWLAMKDRGGEDFTRRVRRAAGADLSASGATRLSGSRNFKAKYAPNFPRVAIVETRPGLLATPEQLAAIGLLPGPAAAPVSARAYAPRTGGRQWLDYQKCLANAPANHSGSGPDVSRADFTFALIAQDWGWSAEATAARLMEQSEKAKENGAAYAKRTCERAAEALSRRGPQNKPHHPQI